jgi:RNA polymerase sigma factor (sigma-70 family)
LDREVFAVNRSLTHRAGSSPPHPLILSTVGDYAVAHSSQLRRIVASARRFRGSAHADDLVQAGRIALWRAMASFDAARGIPFEHFAARAIRRAVRDEARREMRHWKTRQADSPTESPDLFIETIASDALPAFDSVLVNHIRSRVEALPLNLRRIYEARFENDLTQGETASLLCLTQQRVSQLENMMLATLRKMLN